VHVTGVDKDERSIQYARACADSDAIDYICADFLSVPLPAGTYDVITAVVSLYHMDASSALARMRDLLRPGGVLVVIGLARGGSPADIAWSVLAWIGAFLHRSLTTHHARSRNDTYAAPLLSPPPLTYRGMRLVAEQLLPGCRYRRLLYRRYALLWTKPAVAA
jgi:SAM-dependent methyltransferase